MDEKITVNGAYIQAGTFYGYNLKTFLQMLDKPLSKGDRVELIPNKGGVRVMRVKREEVKAR